MTTVYQFCNTCHKERAHKFKTDDLLGCVTCAKETKINSHRVQPVKPDQAFITQMVKGEGLPKVVVPRPKKTQAIAQPLGLLNMMKGARA